MISKRSHSAPGCCRAKPFFKSRQKKADTVPIAEQVESIVHNLIAAINEHRFCPSDSLYEQTVDPDFIGSMRYHWGGREPTNWPNSLSIMQEMVAEYPEYRLERPLMYTEVYQDTPRTKKDRLDDEARFADVFVNFDVEGEPPGVVRQTVAIFRFRRRYDEEQWKCFSFQSLDGCGRCDGLGSVETYVGGT